MNYDRLILDLIDRVTLLEQEMAKLKSQNKNISLNTGIYNDTYNSSLIKSGNSKDNTKYLFEGRSYGKNRLVLAIVKGYVKKHPDISAEMLQIVFDKSLQGSLGVVRKLSEVHINCSDPNRRFFMKDTIITTTGPCVVCSQWGANLNIERFIARSRQLGFNITEVK